MKHLAGQEICHLLQNPKVHYCVYKNRIDYTYIP
jgi:hypothetical protein